jgi:hypothetical protein
LRLARKAAVFAAKVVEMHRFYLAFHDDVLCIR